MLGVCRRRHAVAAVRREVGKWLLVQQRDDLGAGKPTAPESGARAQCTQHRATQSRLDREDADAVQLWSNKGRKMRSPELTLYYLK